jgi:hypothetical protein
MIDLADLPVMHSDLTSPEDQFLLAVIEDGLRLASTTGRYEASFHGYELRAWSEHLGARLFSVTCVLSHHGRQVARRVIGLPTGRPS